MPCRDVLRTRFFNALPHSHWLATYHGRAFPTTHVYTLGNPLVAKDILAHDLALGVNIPPRVLVQEAAGGGTRVLYNLPSAWCTDGEEVRPEVKAALEVLDGKLERMLRKVLS